MTLLKFVILLLIIFGVVLIFNRIFKKKNKLIEFNDGNVEQIIPADKIDTSTSSNYTYSMWFYIEDWNYKYGQQKVLLARNTENNSPCPMISLGAFENDLTVSVETYSNVNSQDLSLRTQTFNCTIKNVPIQSWVNVLVSVNGRILDVYLDGKLVKTCVMPGVAIISGNSPINITPDGGFSGYISYVEYWPHSTNPEEAWNIYRKGHGGNSSNMFNKYNIKVSVLHNNKETASYRTGGY